MWKNQAARISFAIMFPVLWGLAVLAMAAKPSPWERKVSEADGVRAELTYEKSASAPRFRSLRLRVRQGKDLKLNELVPRDRPDDQPLAAQSEMAFQVRDLDRDGQPEILVDLFTGGTHCCTYSLIYRYDADQGRYVTTKHSWGNSFYQLADLNNDGVLEFQSRDDRFTNRFTSYAASANPLQIWRYEQGKLVDRTKDYPQAVEGSATMTLLAMQRVSSERQEAKGVVASYLADKHSQGRAEEGWQLVEKLYLGADKVQFFEQLQRVLQETGYAAGGEKIQDEGLEGGEEPLDEKPPQP
jgi:hypothetical protein